MLTDPTINKKIIVIFGNDFLWLIFTVVREGNQFLKSKNTSFVFLADRIMDDRKNSLHFFYYNHIGGISKIPTITPCPTFDIGGITS